MVPVLRELRLLKEENSKLKKMVADQSLEKQMLQDVIKKNSEDGIKAACAFQYCLCNAKYDRFHHCRKQQPTLHMRSLTSGSVVCLFLVVGRAVFMTFTALSR
jgi:hypothetical protein